MKFISIILSACLLYAVPVWTESDDTFFVSIEPCWECLDADTGSCAQFGGKWVLVGNITFKKRSLKDSIQLQQLKLIWNGPKIEHLSASLYKKNFDPTKKDFLPIDEYLICDGCWNTAKQMLILTFDDKQTLGALEVFYLVLTVPESLEPLLHQGNFHLKTSELPVPFANACQTQPFQLTLNLRK